MPVAASFTVNMLTREQISAIAEVGHNICTVCTSPIAYQISLESFDQGDATESIYLCDDHGVQLLENLNRLRRQFSTAAG
jgi:hypothetical protein